MKLQKRPLNKVSVGFGMLLACHLIFIALLGMVASVWTEPSDLKIYSPEGEPMGASIFLMGFFSIGIGQIFYALPLSLLLEIRLKCSEAAKGVWIAAAITLLLNGSCFLLLAT